MLLANIRAGARLHLRTVKMALSPSGNVVTRASTARLPTAVFRSPGGASRPCATTSANSPPPLAADSGCSSDAGSSPNGATEEGKQLASNLREPVDCNVVTTGALGEAIAEIMKSREREVAAHDGVDGDPVRKKPRTKKRPKTKWDGGGVGGGAAQLPVDGNDDGRQRGPRQSRAKKNDRVSGDDSLGEQWTESLSSSLSSSQTQARENRGEDSSTGTTTGAPTPRFQQFGRPGGGGQIVAAEIFGDRSQVRRSRRDRDATDSREGGWASGMNFGDVHADWGGRSDVQQWLKENVVVKSGTAANMLEREPRISQQRCVSLFTGKCVMDTVILGNYWYL